MQTPVCALHVRQQHKKEKANVELAKIERARRNEQKQASAAANKEKNKRQAKKLAKQLKQDALQEQLIAASLAGAGHEGEGDSNFAQEIEGRQSTFEKVNHQPQIQTTPFGTNPTNRHGKQATQGFFLLILIFCCFLFCCCFVVVFFSCLLFVF